MQDPCTLDVHSQALVIQIAMEFSSLPLMKAMTFSWIYSLLNRPVIVRGLGQHDKTENTWGVL